MMPEVDLDQLNAVDLRALRRAALPPRQRRPGLGRAQDSCGGASDDAARIVLPGC